MKVDKSMRQLFCDSEFHAYAIIRQILYIYTLFFLMFKVTRDPHSVSDQ